MCQIGTETSRSFFLPVVIQGMEMMAPSAICTPPYHNGETAISENQQYP